LKGAKRGETQRKAQDEKEFVNNPRGRKTPNKTEIFPTAAVIKTTKLKEGDAIGGRNAKEWWTEKTRIEVVPEQYSGEAPGEEG